jgi:NodT family efflux transporter outer membrane factor (OMF) lipoprotein
VRARAENGLVAGVDLRQQQAELARATASVPELEALARERIHALSILTGSAPGALLGELKAPGALPVVPAVPVGLPSELLLRRPDLREAERALAAATAEIGVATAELYPRFSLTASPALVSRTLANLLEWGSRNFTGGAAVAWPLFDGGRARGNLEVADARQDQALLAYRRDVLAALKDVEDSLSRYAAEREQLRSLEQALALASDAERLSRTRYQGGLVAFSEVLAAQERRILLEEQMIQSKGAFAREAVALFKALGGGWQPGDTVASAATRHAEQ